MSIELEPVESILRVFDCGKSSSMDPYKATGTVHYHGDVAVLYGFHGELKISDIIDGYRAIRAAGARWILAHRKDGHTIPMGQAMPDGPFAGWWYVDLDALKN